MKELFIVVLYGLIIFGSIVFAIGFIGLIISLIEPWVYFLHEQYNEWAEEIQRDIKTKKKNKGGTNESNINN